MIVIVIALMVGIGVIVKNIISLTIEKKARTEKNNELANKRDELTAELENVNDLDYIEEQARKLLHMIKPGEILYILDGSGNPDAAEEGNGIGLPEGPASTTTESAPTESAPEEEEPASEEVISEEPEGYSQEEYSEENNQEYSDEYSQENQGEDYSGEEESGTDG